MHTVVTQPLTRHGRGAISCRPMGMEPIVFAWTPAVETDASGSEAADVAPGRYRVRATDANADVAEVVVDVAPVHDVSVVVTEYRTHAASTGSARDGRVEAIGSGFDAPGLRLLWTNGVETDGPVLADVPCGRYAAVAASATAGVPVTVHLCAPAELGVVP